MSDSPAPSNGPKVPMLGVPSVYFKIVLERNAELTHGDREALSKQMGLIGWPMDQRHQHHQELIRNADDIRPHPSPAEWKL